jgi:hypothetical protein
MDLLSIPTMNRSVVERTTHPAALEAITQELGGAWTSHQRWLQGRYYSDRMLAGLNLLDRTVPFGEAHFPPAETRRRVQSRLGEEDRLARLDPPPAGPFGARIRTLRVPAFLAAGVPPEAEVVAEETGSGRLRLVWGPQTYVYDRLGLRAVDAPGNEEDALDA